MQETRQEARTYLDYNASAPLRPEARAAVVDALGVAGNPSSVHSAGRDVRRIVEDAREQVAGLVGARPADVVFTSGATEANALALAPRQAGERLLVAAVEHPSVLSGGRFPTDAVETIPVDEDGIVDLAWLEGRLNDHPRVGCVSVMAANNETGVVQPVARVAALARSAGAVVHCDAVQAAGRLPLDMADFGIDLMSLSAHKLGGPMGVGALVRAGDLPLSPLLSGGRQERGQRAGTENVAGIAGFAAAAECAGAEVASSQRMARLRDWLEEEVRAMCPDAVMFGDGVARIANTACFAVPGISAEKAVIALDLEGIAVSSGAACSSGKVGPSHVLAAMGIAPHVAGGAIRASLGWASDEQDIERFLMVWRRVSAALARRRDQAA